MEHYAVLVGVDRVSKIYEKEYSLECAKVNVRLMKSQLESFQNDNHLCIKTFDDKPKWCEVEAYMKGLKEKTKEKDALITFYFSGHSYQLDDDLEASDYMSTQYLYFYDEMVLDKKFLEVFKGFDDDVKIHLILDTCYSGKIPDYEVNIPEKWISIKSCEELEKATVNINAMLNRRLARMSRYRFEYEGYRGLRIGFTNEVLAYAAASGENVAYDNGTNNPSYFTGYILKVSKFCEANYINFFDTVRSQFANNAEPSIHPSNYESLKFFNKYIPFKNKINQVKKCNMGFSKLELYDSPTPLDRVTGFIEFENQEIEFVSATAFPNADSARPNTDIMNYLKEKYDKSQYEIIMQVVIKDGSSKVIDITHDLTKIKYKLNHPKGVVVVTNSTSTTIYGSQPTKGTVTNQLGEG